MSANRVRAAMIVTGLASAWIACGPKERPRDAAPKPAAPPGHDDGSLTVTAADRYLRVVLERDDLAHFELGRGAPTSKPIRTTPMVARPSSIHLSSPARVHGNVLESAELRIEVEAGSLCATVTDTKRGFVLQRVCPRVPDAGTSGSGLTITRESTRDVYGLGEQFLVAGTADGTWMGRERTPGNVHGNAMAKFDGNAGGEGSVGNAQFPVLYAAGPGTHAYAMFLDDTRAQTFSFKGDPWTVASTSEALRWYVMAGPDLADLRKDFMNLVGHAPVPPKKAFGLWISEYGFDDWRELEDKLRTLRAHHFPVDGFVLDLQWFGDVTPKSDTSRMGTLDWDRKRFPDPEKAIARLRDEQGIGLMPIEESYVSRGLPEHADLARRGFLAKDCATCPPTYIQDNPWWGFGGMIDWSNAAGADYWHDTKRQALVDAGVIGHWCDLGEPEMFHASSWYTGSPAYGEHAHDDVHNLFSFLWVASIQRGYERHGVVKRPFMMSRSGAPGIQRFGASMWSGDIGSNLTTLSAHFNAQMNMSMSGIDYFGADIGGFIREALRGDLKELYTQWFADGMMVDVPGRVHTWNTENDHESAPDRVGDLASNLASVRRRYELVPYVYSLAHRAWLYGEPVFPPLVYVFPEDESARPIGGEKMIGRDLLAGMIAHHGDRKRDVYLPPGTWMNVGTGAWHTSRGEWLRGVSAMRDGHFELPLFARAGAIIPVAFVDDATWNVLGKRGDGTRHDELRARIYASTEATRFTLYEDDGETILYQRGEVRMTEIAQAATAEGTRGTVTVNIAAAQGTYRGAPAQRDAVLDVYVDGGTARAATLDGAALPALDRAKFDASPRGWMDAGGGLVRIKTGALPIEREKKIVVTTTLRAR
jgi:alpha-glucosidase (family GH31 glycosyl hydrolase)